MFANIPPTAQPIIVGIGQLTQRTNDVDQAREPLDLISSAIRAAVTDTGVALLPAVDALLVVNQISWLYDDLPRQISARLGMEPGYHFYSSWGGTQPTRLLDQAARRIAMGESRVVVVCGGEALRSCELFDRAGRQPPWTAAPPDGLSASMRPIDPQAVVSAAAWQHGLRMPINVYPLYENRLRYAAALSTADNQRWSAELWSGLSRVAATNPAAWYGSAVPPEQIVAVSTENRMICHPYPKLMNALMAVDQAAAVVLTDTDMARQLGIPEEHWIYIWGGRGAHEQPDFLLRPDYERSEAMELVLDETLAMAARTINEIDVLELYSCFPCVPKLAIRHLGLDHTRPISVAGGLTFFGGPGNNYMLHAAVAMAAALRRGDGQHGLLYGQGGYVTYHHALVLARAARPDGYSPDEWANERQTRLEARPVPELDETPSGRATIETYTVVYDRHGEYQTGIIVGRLAHGARFVANTPPDDLASLRRLVDPHAQLIGANGRVGPGPNGTNCFELDR